MKFDGKTFTFDQTEFLYFFITENNHNKSFFERDTFFCRFNNNIVDYSEIREVITYLPKNLEELVTPWPVSSIVEGEYKVFYINEQAILDNQFIKFLESINLGSIFILEKLSNKLTSKLKKHVHIPIITVKENNNDFDEIIKIIVQSNKKNLELQYNGMNFDFLDKTDLLPVEIPSVNFLRPLGALINRTRGLYDSTYSNQIIVEPSNSKTYLKKEEEAKEWILYYLKMTIVEKYIVYQSLNDVDELIKILRNNNKNLELNDEDDLSIEELIKNYEWLLKYYMANFDEVKINTDMIFYLPMMNKFLLEEINKMMGKKKMPKKLLKKIYDSTGYYGTYSEKIETKKEEIYLEVFFRHLGIKAVENRTMDTLLTNHSLGTRAPYIRCSNVPASDLNIWYSHMSKNVIRNSELLEIEKFNVNKEKIGNLLKKCLTEEIINLIISNGKYIKFVTDAPIEWIENKGVPLGILKSISRLPVIPGNNLVTHSYIDRNFISLANLKVLIINGLNPEDCLYSYGKELKKLYENKFDGLNGKIFYKEPNNKKEFIQYIKEIRPTVFVFYGHGSFNNHDHEGKLHIKSEAITARELEEIEWGAMITILGACETQTFDDNYLNIANMFVGLGSASVLGTYFPVDGALTYIFLESLFRHLTNALQNKAPKSIINNWADVILQSRRSLYLIEPIEPLKKYFNKKKINFEFEGIADFVSKYCMRKVENSISEAYLYRDEAYRAFFCKDKKALECFEYVLKHKYIYHESLAFTSLGSPEKITISR